MSWVWHRPKQRLAKPDWNRPVSLEGDERLQHLYEWERRCRGYEVFAQSVPLEPPFAPFDPEDAGSGISPAYPYIEAGHASNLAHLSLLLPREQKVTAQASESLLRSWQGLRFPLSFEIVADADEVTYQVTCGKGEAETVASSLSLHFPQAQVEPGRDTLWQKMQPLLESQPLLDPVSSVPPHQGVLADYHVVDFGLLHFAFQPLLHFASFAADPLGGLVAALGTLREGEVAGLQVLLVPARQGWAASLQRVAAAFESDERVYGESLPLWQAKQKTASPLFACTVRVFGVSATGDGLTQGGASGEENAFDLCRKVGQALSGFSDPHANALLALDNEGYPHPAHLVDVLKRQSHRSGMLLSAQELSGLVHPPCESLHHPKLLRHDPKEQPLPEHLSLGHGTVLGLHTFRNQQQALVWPDEFRNRHAYILGATRMGKSTLLLNLLAQDMEAGRGLCLIDPHGDLALDVLERVSPERVADVLYLDFADRDFPPSMGLLEAHDEWERRLLTSDVLSVLKRLFSSSWGDRLEHMLRHALLTLLAASSDGSETKDSSASAWERNGTTHGESSYTLRDIRPLLSDKAFRETVLKRVPDPELRAFWHGEFPSYSASTFAPIYNKLGLVLPSPLVRNVVAQKQSRLHLPSLINAKKVLLVNLNSSLIGSDNAHFLGALLVSRIQIAAMQSLRQGRAGRTPFTLYVDEFQNFVVSSFETILSEAGKAGLSLVMANQFLEQLGSSLQTAILGNVGTMVSFRVSSDSGRLLEKELAGRFTQSDMVSLSRGEAVARVGSASDSFAIQTLPPPSSQQRSLAPEIRERTQRECCRPRTDVEAELALKEEAAAKKEVTAGEEVKEETAPRAKPRRSDTGDELKDGEGRRDSALFNEPADEETPPAKPAKQARSTRRRRAEAGTRRRGRAQTSTPPASHMTEGVAPLSTSLGSKPRPAEDYEKAVPDETESSDEVMPFAEVMTPEEAVIAGTGNPRLPEDVSLVASLSIEPSSPAPLLEPLTFGLREPDGDKDQETNNDATNNVIRETGEVQSP